MHFDKSLNFSSTSGPQNVKVKKMPPGHMQKKIIKNGLNSKRVKPTAQSNLVAAINVRDSDKAKFSGKNKPQKPAEGKAESQTQKVSEKFQSTSLKQAQSPVFKKDVSGPIKDTRTSRVKSCESANEKHRKRKHSSKKSNDGASNWMKLCAALNIDASVRKTKPVKRPATDSSSEQADHSEPKRNKPGLWFDNVDKILIEADAPGSSDGEKAGESDPNDRLVKPDSFKGVTNCVAMDCEMVGVGPQGEESILARVSIVNHFGVCLYDKFVLPREKVTDYRTYVSGVTAENLATGEEFTKVQSEVSELIKGRILVGHAVHNDLKVLFLTQPHKMIRDTSLYKPFRELFSGRLPSLKKLAEKVLGVKVQEGQHSSVQDAQATMRLYTMYRQKWEKELRKERKMDRRRKKKKQNKKENVG